MKPRTKQFAPRIMRLVTSLPPGMIAHEIGRQLLRSGLSVGAHYREAGRARPNAEFISKIEIGLQELEETGYWLELLTEGDIVKLERLQDLMAETVELIAIFTTIVKRTKLREK